MNYPKTNLVVAIWGVCALSIAGAIVMVIFEVSHPLADPGRRNLWLVYSFPYLVVGVSAWVLRRSGKFLIFLLVATALVATYGTFAKYVDLQTTLGILDRRATGKVAMSCNPPMAMFAMVLEYGFALFIAALALRLLPYRPDRTS